MLSHPVGRLRVVSFVEGLSYLILVLVAMPLKYVWGEPGAVRVFGMAHGVLFVAFCLALVLAAKPGRLSLRDQAVIFAWSLVPFGFLVIEKRLRTVSATEA